MPLLSFDEIKSKLEHANAGIYFLCGDESYPSEGIIKFLRERFNVVTFYANKCDDVELSNEYCQPSIFNDKKVILVHALNDSPFLLKDRLDGFVSFLQRAEETNNTNILVFTYTKKLTPKENLYTIFEKYNLLVSNVLTADKKLGYLDSYCKNNNINIGSDCLSTLVKSGCSLRESLDFVNLYKICGDVDGNTFLKCFSRTQKFDALDFMISLANRNKNKICSFLKSFNNADSFEVIPFSSLLYTFFLKTLLSRYSSSASFLYKISVKNYSTSTTLEILHRIKYLDECLKGLHSHIKPFSNVLFLFNFIFRDNTRHKLG